MIAVDTNILVRLLTHDDKEQAAYAAKLIQNNAIFISNSVLLETGWVLRHSYDLDEQVVYRSFEMLLGLPRVTVEDPLCVMQALAWYQKGFDFADALHLASSQQAEQFASLDLDFIKKARKHHIQMITMDDFTEKV